MLIRLITSDPTEVASAGERLLHYCNPIQTEHFGSCGFAASGRPDHKRTCLRFCTMSALAAPGWQEKSSRISIGRVRSRVRPF